MCWGRAHNFTAQHFLLRELTPLQILKAVASADKKSLLSRFVQPLPSLSMAILTSMQGDDIALATSSKTSATTSVWSTLQSVRMYCNTYAHEKAKAGGLTCHLLAYLSLWFSPAEGHNFFYRLQDNILRSNSGRRNC